MVKNKLVLSAMAVLATLSLAACSSKKSSSSASSAATTGATVKLSSVYNNSGKTNAAADNGTLKIAEPNDSPFQGISDPELATNAEDTDVFAPGGGDSLFNVDKNFKIIDGGLANQTLDRKNNTATITLQSGAKWSNGMPITAKDIEYAYEVVANKDTTSQQYSSDLADIKGMNAYHMGKAKTISGITYPDGQNGKSIVIHFSHMAPSMQYSGNTFILGSVEPYEYIKNVPIAKLAASAQIRKDPIFVGPYKLDKVVEGESTTWSLNKYYLGKKPQIKHISINVVSSNNIDKAIQSKKYDFTSPQGVMRGTDYHELKNTKGYKIVGYPALAYDYFGFNVGSFNPKTGENVMDPNGKMSNKSLRQAMMYAVNGDQLSKKFGYGMSWRANTLIPPIFGQYWDSTAKGFPLNIKKANQLLDKAGYKKKGQWRVQPNGKPLKINFGAMTGTSAQAAEYQDMLQQWHKIGLDVQLTGGKTMEMNSFYATLQEPKQSKIDIWAGAWSLSSEPTPTSLYGQDATFNMGHFVSAENTKLMNEMNSNKAWNNSYRIKVFKQWQNYMNDQAAVAPETFSYTWAPVNARVKGYADPLTNNNFWSDLSLTSTKLQ